MLKTKSEVSAITDFLDWLESVCKKNDKKGVLLICHENYKFNPHLLIKSLLKYVHEHRVYWGARNIRAMIIG